MDAVAYPIIGHGEYAERGLPSLRATGGDCGGGSEALIVQAVASLAGDISKARDVDHTEDRAPSLRAGVSGTTQVPTIAALVAGAVSGVRRIVRRLMPVECERLQGFPDGWTDIRYRGKPATDGHRYKGLGNSMAVPVVRWIAKRLIGAIEAARDSTPGAMKAAP